MKVKHPYCPLAMLAAAILLVSCSGGAPNGSRGFGPAPVTVAVVGQQSVPVELRAIGNIEAASIVEVRAQVGGRLDELHFERGQIVHSGDLLFQIDPRSYTAALAEAEAVLARDRSLLRNARQEVRRYAGLVEKDFVTREQYDQAVTTAEALESTVKADEAAVERARLELEYCSIRSPINGRAGDILVHPGNLIKANSDSPLVVLLQTRPVLAAFSAPERYLDEIRRVASRGAIEVKAYPQSAGGSSVGGKLDFIDNRVDTTTGTILLKAIFNNENEELWPGQFVDVVMVLSTQENAVIVPGQAVQRGQEGTYVFVVKEDSTVESRPVVVDRDWESSSVIAEGLVPGETVVTDGQLRLVPGASVEIKNQP
jgi:multidrug efflux system membrane fusion protein